MIWPQSRAFHKCPTSLPPCLPFVLASPTSLLLSSVSQFVPLSVLRQSNHLDRLCHVFWRINTTQRPRHPHTPIQIGRQAVLQKSSPLMKMGSSAEDPTDTMFQSHDITQHYHSLNIEPPKYHRQTHSIRSISFHYCHIELHSILLCHTTSHRIR